VERHPVVVVGGGLGAAGVLPARELLARGAALRDQSVRVAGLCICRQKPPTASGLTFLTLEDETGFANLIVMPAIARRDREGLRATLVLGTGRVEFADGVVNIKAERLQSLDDVQKLEGVQRHDYR
jgi:error-prone DNA polymerase